MKTYTTNVRACSECPGYNRDEQRCTKKVDRYQRHMVGDPLKFDRRVEHPECIPDWCPLADVPNTRTLRGTLV